MLSFDTLDFTIHEFWELSNALVSNYDTITMSEYLSSKELPEKFALIRHDVDRLPENALETARIESELGIKATYYFRTTKNVFVPEIIKEVSNLGHEVGYHYEVLSETNGDYDKAIAIFEKNLKKFRKICDVNTICMHGRPLSKFDNRDLWKVHDFRKFGLLGEAYLSAGKELNYFSDTGRSWGSKNSLRDFIPGKTENFSVDTTPELIDLVESKKLNNIYILSHPERWSCSMFDWGLYFGMDFAVNFVKKGLMAVRK
ncbi:hypothetical protein FTO70_05175 [Methanosarcina sp. KYL-1]|uniref:hypothetical protein n=1 Tax=Methanosarcina sp. KYL-1 TaxID=2602068 RepID=UPI002100DB74|nr:hypothetical protein [Methanosarcina sp. KYL-1]MCQ1535089.1 hypothetical protein [Methanosarcina sp. KYL-1]